MGSLADDASGIQDEDLVGIADRRDPLGDDEHRGTALMGLQRSPEPGISGDV